jgi:hypothetical protein
MVTSSTCAHRPLRWGKLSAVDVSVVQLLCHTSGLRGKEGNSKVSRLARKLECGVYQGSVCHPREGRVKHLVGGPVLHPGCPSWSADTPQTRTARQLRVAAFSAPHIPHKVIITVLVPKSNA